MLQDLQRFPRFADSKDTYEDVSTFEKEISMTTVMKNKDVYHVKNAIKLGQYNVGREGDILAIPLYMGFLVDDKLAGVIIPDVDVSLLNV